MIGLSGESASRPLNQTGLYSAKSPSFSSGGAQRIRCCCCCCCYRCPSSCGQGPDLLRGTGIFVTGWSDSVAQPTAYSGIPSVTAREHSALSGEARSWGIITARMSPRSQRTKKLQRVKLRHLYPAAPTRSSSTRISLLGSLESLRRRARGRRIARPPSESGFGQGEQLSRSGEKRGKLLYCTLIAPTDQNN